MYSSDPHALSSIVLGWILIYQNRSIRQQSFFFFKKKTNCQSFKINLFRNILYGNHSLPVCNTPKNYVWYKHRSCIVKNKPLFILFCLLFTSSYVETKALLSLWKTHDVISGAFTAIFKLMQQGFLELPFTLKRGIVFIYCGTQLTASEQIKIISDSTSLIILLL